MQPDSQPAVPDAPAEDAPRTPLPAPEHGRDFGSDLRVGADLPLRRRAQRRGRIGPGGMRETE